MKAENIQTSQSDLLLQYQKVRAQTEALCKPLETDDYQIQSIVETSPPKWHIAHVSWFFETFVLADFAKDYRPFNPDFAYLFNSYYETVGKMHPRPKRGLLSRPSVEEVFAYRQHVDQAMQELLQQTGNEQQANLNFRVILGLNHEQQHQELMLMDVKHNFWCNPLRPVYQSRPVTAVETPLAAEWLEVQSAETDIGHDGDSFCFDNETPRHQQRLNNCSIANCPVSNGEFLEFIEAGGYQQPQHWLADGWYLYQKENIEQPLYWEKIDSEWWQFTLAGMQKLNLDEPVCHISFYEAHAYASWKGVRLAEETELEHLLQTQPVRGNFVESGLLRPTASTSDSNGYGNVWEWTQSAYKPYPGFRPMTGSMGEYNGKFMCNQMVLKGGCALTPQDHIRPSYRNFFYPHDRWPMTGIRLAKDA